jgi:N-methylhydantoinase A
VWMSSIGMRSILCPRASGVLCALGLAAAAPRRDTARTVMLAGEDLSAWRLAAERDALVGGASEALASTGPEDPLGSGLARVRVRYELRYRGQSFELAVEEDELVDPETLRESFARAHERRYGYRDRDADVELVTIRASAWGDSPAPELPVSAEEPPLRRPCRIVLDGRELEAESLSGELPPDTMIIGPAICALPESTLLVPPGWRGEVDAQGSVRIRHTPVGKGGGQAV